MMKKFVSLFAFVWCVLNSFSQSLAINTDGSTAHGSAMLEVKSAIKGMLIPRMSKAQRNAIITPATGLLIYQIAPDSVGFYYYQNSQWNWITDNKKSDTTYWGLQGNINTNPPPNFPFGVFNYNYLGTPDPKDVSLVAGGNELLRLKQFALGGRIGMSNQNPEYALDIRTTENTVSTAINGMRIIPKELYDFNSSINMDKGLVIGNDPVTITENIIWNHSNNLVGAIRIGLSNYNAFVRPAVNINQYGQGIYQKTPKYLLDIHSNSSFANTAPTTSKNGVRITYHNQENQNSDEKGLFMGVGLNINSFKSYLWNYTDGPSSNSPDRAIYFGVGSDMDLSSNRATMQLQNGKITIGYITDPNFFFPSTLNIQTSYASGVAKNGISVMQHMSNTESAYFGLDGNDNLTITKYGTNDILLNSNNADRLIIKSNGNIGINNNNPNAPLQFDNSSSNRKIVLRENANNDHQFYGLGINGGNFRYQVGNVSDNHIFYAGSGSSASDELMRIKGNGDVGIGTPSPANKLTVDGSADFTGSVGIGTSSPPNKLTVVGSADFTGNVGIGTNTPNAALQFSNSVANRKIVFFEVNNNDHQYYGFGNNGSTLRYQVDDPTSSHVFYAGAGTISSIELMRIQGNGNVGIGISNPNALLQFPNNTLNRKIVLWESANNDNQFYGLGINGGVFRYQVGDVGDNHVFYAGAGSAASNELMRIKGNGNVGIGTNNPTERLHVIGNILASGTITPSDARYKKGIRPITNSLEKLQQINGVTYQFNQTAFPEWQFDDKRQYGLIAQEVEKVFPEMVKQINAEGYKGVDYVKLIPVLLEAIKELKKENNLQQQQIDQLSKAWGNQR